MRVLALSPYHGGSHRAFLEGWISRSRHQWTVLSLEPRKWKWRMRQSAVTLADRVGEATPDLVFVTDMLNLAEFRGLAPEPVRNVPSAAYFHENQLTYPVDHPSDFDYHFAFTNLTTALAADRVWWNSAYHRDSMLEGLGDFLKRMPDHQPLDAPDRIRAKSEIRYPGIESFPTRGERAPGPLRVLWAARWEEDKDPATFFQAIDALAKRGADFTLDVIGGGRARTAPAVFAEARAKHADRIRRWGYLDTRDEYVAALLDADVAASTARHEFFGIALLEAAAAGAFPLVPNRLAYPEVLDEQANPDFFYDGSPEALADRLAEIADTGIKAAWNKSGDPDRGIRAAAAYGWDRLAPAHDDALEALIRSA